MINLGVVGGLYKSVRLSFSYFVRARIRYVTGFAFLCLQLKLSQYDGTAPLAADIQSQSVTITTTYWFTSTFNTVGV